MLRKFLAVLAVAAVVSVNANASTIVYDASAQPFFTSGAHPHAALDEGAFTGVPGTGPMTIDGVNTAFYSSVAGPLAFDLQVNFFNHIDPAAPAGSPVNIGYLGGITVPIRNFVNDPGFFYTIGMTDLPAPIELPDQNWGAEVRFLGPGTNQLMSSVETIFAAGANVKGFSDDLYWRDADGNGRYDATDARSFGGGNKANLYLQLRGTRSSDLIPEPGTLALLGTGLLPLIGLIRRRR